MNELLSVAAVVLVVGGFCAIVQLDFYFYIMEYLLREDSLFICFWCHEDDRTLHSSAPIRVRRVKVPRRDSKDSSI